jgi:hypothetical protein
MFLFGITVLAGLGLSIQLGLHQIIFSEARQKYQRWNRLNMLMATRHQSKCMIFTNSLWFIGKLIYLAIIQYMNSSVLKLGYNTYLVQYMIAGKLYKMIVKPRRGPVPVLQVIDDLGCDVTQEVLPYLGPNYNWHHNNELQFEEVFGSVELTFNTSSGQEIHGTQSNCLDEKI